MNDCTIINITIPVWVLWGFVVMTLISAALDIYRIVLDRRLERLKKDREMLERAYSAIKRYSPDTIADIPPQ